MQRGPQGRSVRCEAQPEPFFAFVPQPLPPQSPLQLDSNLYDLLEHANRALGRLDGVATLLPRRGDCDR